MNVLKVDFQASNASELFARSLHETGFAVVANHPIAASKISQVYQEWQRFFASEDKFNYLFDPVRQDGYVPITLSETAKGYDIKDLKEFYHIYPNGRCPTTLSPLTRDLYKEMVDLASALLAWIEIETPIAIKRQFSMPLPEMIRDSQRALFRILHYPPLRGDEPEGAVRAAAHEDINLITLLPAATASGLQVKDNGGNWQEVESDLGMIVVNSGDMLQMCSQHYYPSTTHRVINPVGELAKQSRLSMPMFLHPRADVRLSTTHTADEYLQERLREIGLLESEKISIE